MRRKMIKNFTNLLDSVSIQNPTWVVARLNNCHSKWYLFLYNFSTFVIFFNLSILNKIF